MAEANRQDEVQWSWNEEKMKEALEGFRDYLKSEGDKGHLKQDEDRQERARQLLENATTIDGLTKEQLAELLRDTDAYAGDRKRFAVRKIERGNESYIQQVKDWLKRLIAYGSQEPLPQDPLPTMENLRVGYASELLTMRFPERFYLLNSASEEGMRQLGQGELPSRSSKAYPAWRPLFEDLRQRIDKVVRQELGRQANFYDVDLFLWYVARHASKQETSGEEGKSDAQTTSPSPLASYFWAKGFHFTEEQIAVFYAALKTKGFVILSGLSGTGKTKLAQLFAELLCPKCSGKKGKECTHLFLSVRPDWRDSKALLGYYNPLTERYESTPLLKFLLRAKDDYEQKRGEANPYFVILDEMNLSHVEYYFADFLSVLESGRDEQRWTKEPLRLYPPDHEKRNEIEQKQGIPPELKLPPNLYIIGTVNIDETTYMFSPKVLDRAFTIEFRDVDFGNYPAPKSGDAQQIAEQIRNAILADLRNGGQFCAVVADKKEIGEAIAKLGDKKQELEELNEALKPYDLHFGYRVLDEIALFVQNAPSALDVVGKLSADDALDYAVLMKVLPKFHGPRQRLEKPLWRVLYWCLQSQQDSNETEAEKLLQKVWKQITGKEEQPSGDKIADRLENWTSIEGKFRYPNTAKKVLQMLRQLYETGFASFAQ